MKYSLPVDEFIDGEIAKVVFCATCEPSVLRRYEVGGCSEDLEMKPLSIVNGRPGESLSRSSVPRLEFRADPISSDGD